MPPKRDFRSKKSLNVVTFKGGKAIRKSKFSVPVRYATQQLTDTTSVVAGSSLNTCGGFSPDQEDLPNIDEYHGLRTNQRSKSKKVRLKCKLKAYHERKATLALSWLNAREQLVSALLTRQALPLEQMCVIPFCEEEACGRCLHCSPGQFLCADHINLVHAGGRSLHHPEVWKDGRFVPYQFGECVWTTPHNMDHGYVRDIMAVGLHGQQNPIKIKCCEHEPEAITLVRNGFWPSTPKQPQIKDIYQLLVGDCFCKFQYMSSRRREVNLSLLMHCLDVSANAVLELVESPQIMERNCSLAKKK
ncbi:uncharacterized protein [Pocillopora verrucosa]|uniref:uncharacterized protein isoform X1 n=1 Tax=Pocillopora verrucosa TaxID=203993 RepID=UPI003341249D